jgi:glycosyltransferase involved in cell wall biosynthesis
MVCEENYDSIVSRIGKLSNLGISYNGVEIKEFKNYNKIESRKILNINEKKKIILFLGRYSGPEYRINLLLDAFPEISNKIEDCELYLVGDRITEWISKHPTTKMPNVIIKNQVPHDVALHYISASDVCIGSLGPTHSISLKMLEYMACGKPIVTGKDSVSKEVASNGLNCIAPYNINFPRNTLFR